jgi:hypothetical protein
MLNVVMLNVVMLNVVMLRVVAPIFLLDSPISILFLGHNGSEPGASKRDTLNSKNVEKKF